MRVQERSLQQLDPLTAATSWDSSVFIVITAWCYALFSSVMSLSHTENFIYLVLAIVLITASFSFHLWWATPRRAPYTKWSFALVVFLGISAGVFQILALGSTVETFSMEWGPIAVALLFAAGSGYRPLPDQYYAGLAAVLTLGGTLVLVGIDANTPYGPGYFAVAGVSLIVIVVLGQASYTQKAMSVMRKWQKSSTEQLAETPVETTSASVEITEPFIDEVKGFYLQLLESGKIGNLDVERARQLSTEIRAELHTASSQTWVEQMGCELRDEDGLLGELDSSAKSTISAVIGGLRDEGADDLVLSLRLDPGTTKLSCVLLGKTGDTQDSVTNKVRTKLSPYLRVMYVIFDDVRIIEHDGEIKVLFYYAR